MLIDSHCHLHVKGDPGAVDRVLERARAAGVRGFLCIGVGAEVAPMQQALELAIRCDDVLAAVGTHPHEASGFSEELLVHVTEMCCHPRVVGVGEIGLDYHYEWSPRSIQTDVFRRFVRLAREVRKPIVVHTREAADDTLRVLHEEQAQEVGGVFHCYSEDVAFARRVLDLGFDISFSGIVTFPKANVLHDVVRFVPSDRYLVETDSPYLAPVPFRGKRCEPAFLVHTVRRIAELRNESVDQVISDTGANFGRRFGVGRAPWYR